ncbi:MAG: carboxypeptidase-like regulatory domain-containing protein, partial [Saprospiraceae bacterium]
MKKKLLAIGSLFYLFIFSLTAQTTLHINGMVTDSSGEALSHASILILDAQDSTYIGFTQSDNSGNFNIKEKTDKPIILKISYLGYFSFEKRIDPLQTTKLELGAIRLTPINKVLFEVVIKEAKAPLKMRGDTIEYDASTFKVPIGSTVEDLLRKLPGIEVANDGSITSQGQSVNKLTVDGKRFFG